MLEQRVSVITLGVADVQSARKFYETLGWHVDDGVDDDTDQIVFFQAGGLIVSLWDRAKLAADGGLTDRGGWAGVTLGYCVGSPGHVDRVLSDARAAGGTITRPPGNMFWGGYSGVFTDLDGHPWEVLHNPAWTLRDDGSVSLLRDVPR